MALYFCLSRALSGWICLMWNEPGPRLAGLGLNISLVLNQAQAQKVTTVQELFGLNDSAQQKNCAGIKNLVL